MDHERIRTDDVLGRYRRDVLDEPERHAFEIHMIACKQCQDDLRADAALVQALTEAERKPARGTISRRPNTPAGWVPYAAAASVLLVSIAAATAWLAAHRSLSAKSSHYQASRAQVLFLHRTRGMQLPPATPFAVDPATETVVLVLDGAQPELTTYSVQIKNESGVTVWSADGLRVAAGSDRPELTALVPGSILRAGLYRIEVSGSNGMRVMPSAIFNIRVTAAGP